MTLSGYIYARAGDPLFKPLDGEFSTTFGAQLQDCSEGSILIWINVSKYQRLKSRYMACSIAYFQRNEGFSQISLVIRGLPNWLENLDKPR